MPEERSNTRPTLCFRIFSFSKHEPQFLPTRHFTLSEMFWSQVSGPFVVATCVLRFFCRYVTPSKQVVHMLPKNAMWCHRKEFSCKMHHLTWLLSYSPSLLNSKAPGATKARHTQNGNTCGIPSLRSRTCVKFLS